MRRTLVLVTVSLAFLGTLAPSALAQGGTGYTVTIAARQCPTYTDITANRARNDIQESLEDLGANTPYVAGQPIDPVIEANYQPRCTPLNEWDFTLGEGILTQEVVGSWGALSIVTNPYSTAIRTLPQTPLLDPNGVPTGQSIAGAVTIELTKAQLERATRGNSLWIQGGTVTDPILNQRFPDQYGFGALRCAIDNLNGDNVEWISYPQGSDHVFCYAYYVTPPPTSGRIIIEKAVEAEPPGRSETFTFAGNLSYNPSGTFEIRGTSGSTTAAPEFYRASGETWTANELVPPGWVLTGLDCRSAPAPGGGASSVVEDLAAAEVRIALAPLDTVTCTFTNALRPPPGQLFIRKITRGGTGLFNFEILPAAGGASSTARARTTEPNVPVQADPSPLPLEAGDYRVDERLPRRPGGTWRLARATCNGQLAPTRRGAQSASVNVTIEPGLGAACTFVNRFTPAGGIIIQKATVGGTGSAGFSIQSVRDPDRTFEQAVTTQEPGEPLRARGDRTIGIPLGRYVIQEHNLAPEDGERWTLTEVLCENTIVPSEEGRVEILLTPRNPVVRCLFVNTLNTTPVEPVPPEPPGPGGGGAGEPDLVVVKSADRPVAGIGEVVTYTVRISNEGNVAAENVVLADQPGLGEKPIAARPRLGARCKVRQLARELYICRVGNLAPGERRVYEVDMRVTASSGRRVNNRTAVGSGTGESNVRNNVDGARVRVRRLGCLPSRVAARGSVRAHASC